MSEIRSAQIVFPPNFCYRQSNLCKRPVAPLTSWYPFQSQENKAVILKDVYYFVTAPHFPTIES